MQEKPQKSPDPGVKPQVPKWLVYLRNLNAKQKIALGAVAVVFASIGIFRKSPRVNDTTNAEQQEAPDQTSEELLIRKKLSDFKVVGLDGQSRQLSDFRTKVTILTFWASWSAPCLEELTRLALLHKSLGAHGLEIVPVNVDEDMEAQKNAVEYWKKKAFPFPTYYDQTRTLATEFKVDQLPSEFVIDRSGNLVFSTTGTNDWSSPFVIEPLQELLRESVQTWLRPFRLPHVQSI